MFILSCGAIKILEFVGKSDFVGGVDFFRFDNAQTLHLQNRKSPHDPQNPIFPQTREF